MKETRPRHFGELHDREGSAGADQDARPKGQERAAPAEEGDEAGEGERGGDGHGRHNGRPERGGRRKAVQDRLGPKVTEALMQGLGQA